MTTPGWTTITATLSRLPASCPPGGVGWSAALACLLEATAPKPGNVHPAARFADLAYDDLVAAGLAIAPAMQQAAHRPLGRTILDAVTAARAVSRSNANLGIVLAIAPLAAAARHPAAPGTGPEGAATGHRRTILLAAVEAVLSRLTPTDAADVWQAISLAAPGGMGASTRWDLGGPPPDDLRAAMGHAACQSPADQIARLWVAGYGGLLDGPVHDLEAELTAGPSAAAGGQHVLDAIVRCHLRHLAREPDTLIARRHGVDVAADVSRRAAAVLAEPGDGWRAAAAAFDRHLRAGRRLNPGTTADLVAAALYILIQEAGLEIPLDLRIPDDAAIPAATEPAAARRPTPMTSPPNTTGPRP